MRLSFALTVASALVLNAAAYAAMPVPRPAKEFTFIEPSGKQTLLSSFKGKVVVIQFLSTTCSHCQATSRELSAMKAEMPGVQFMGVAFNEATPSMADAYVKQLGIHFPVAYAGLETVLSFLGFSATERLTVPQMAIIDKKGVIRAQSAPLGSPELQDRKTLTPLINRLLSEGGAAKGSAK
jgi:thiol-disulfide isomerase/thioredoxin